MGNSHRKSLKGTGYEDKFEEEKTGMMPLPSPTVDQRPSTSEIPRKSLIEDQFSDQPSPMSENRRSTFSVSRKFSPAPRYHRPFSFETCQLLKNSWSTVQKRAAERKEIVGISVFRRVFHECPELKIMFHVRLDQTIDELPDEHAFCRHARVFTNLIDLVARNVEELDTQISPVLVTYGRRHYSKHKVGFSQTYTSVFARSMVTCIHELMGDQFSTDHSVAWDQLIRFVIHKMKQGYDQEIMQKGRRFSLGLL